MDALSYYPAKEPYYLKGILNLLSYSYNQLVADKSVNKYSRKKILQQHIEVKGNEGKKTKLELEDYLRNDLVTCYIQKHQKEFSELKYFQFIPGADEIANKITIGSLDLKVIIPTSGYSITGNYLAIEFKRINKEAGKKRYYVDGGVKKFIDRQYYPEIDTPTATMVGIMEAEKNSYIENAEKIASSINTLLNNNHGGSILEKLNLIRNDLEGYDGVEIYNSKIKRVDNSELNIIHIFLDYYNLIET
tara:strand:+ start:11272 stop:12012 length:741 start_codon:yes stop_codon:yes gene_type:complete